MQISPSAALFQALSSLSQPQATQAFGAGTAPLGKAAAKQAAETQTQQAVPSAQTADSEVRIRQPADGERLERGSLVDISA